MTPKTRSLRSGLVALALLVAVPLLAFVGYVLLQLAGTQRELEETRVTESAQAVTALVDAELRRAQALLEGLATSGHLRRGDLAAFHEQASRLTDGPDRWIVLFNSQRDQLLNTLKPWGEALPREVLAPAVEAGLRTGAPTITNVLAGSVAGEAVVGTGIPLERDGRMEYFLSLTIRAASMGELLGRQSSPRGWSAAVLDGDGVYVARSPDGEGHVGHRASGVLRAAAAASLAAGEAVALEGAGEVVAASASAMSGWTAIVSAPEAALNAPMRRSLWLLGGGGGVLLALTFALSAPAARRIAEPMTRLASSAASLGEGRFVAPPPAGVAELDAVGRALSEAAALVTRHQSEMAASAASLKESEEKLREAQEIAGLGRWEFDIATQRIAWSPEVFHIFGRDPALGPPSFEQLHDLIHPRDRARFSELVQAAVVRGEDFETEWRALRPDGSHRWKRTQARVYRDEEGRPVRLLGADLDITERKQAEERQAFLLAELDHRVKNTLAMVQAIASQTLGSAESAEAFYGRISALAHAHAILSGEGWRGAELGQLLGHILGAHRGGGERIQVSGPPVVLEPKLSQSIALALHELCTNAAKYGALSTPGGRVEVKWTLEEDPAGVRLVWRERGGPPPAPGPRRRGFGSALIERSLVYEFRAAVEMNFLDDGLRCSILLPTASSAAVGEPARPGHSAS